MAKVGVVKVRLAPKLSRLALEEAFAAARFTEAAAAIDAAPLPLPPWALLLRVRVALKRDPARAMARLAEARVVFTSDRERAEAALLEGIAAARLRDPRSAAARFKLAGRLDRPAGDFTAEIAYQRAASRWIERDPGAAASLDEIRDPAPGLALEIAILRGAIAASAGDVRAQAATLLDARSLVRAPASYALAHAVLVSQLATLARDLPSDAVRDAAVAELDRVVWTPDLRDFQFVALRSIGFRHALDGDDFGAFRSLRASAIVAPSDAWRVTALCDRAYLARALGERRWSEQELGDARELADGVDWNATTGEERHGLLLLAERCAERDGALALSYVARYRGVTSRYDATLAATSDRRLEALESYSLGVVRLALGETAEAVTLLRAAWTIYDAIGYRWRASRAAARLAEATRDVRWQRLASEAGRLYPASWLAQPSSEPDASRGLTPAQREVYDALRQGQSVAEIAAAQSRSIFTIRNHIKVILRAFEVTSIAQLIAVSSRTANSAKPPAGDPRG